MVRSAKEAFNEWLRTHDLREFFVWWDQVTPGEKDELTSLLETADSERPIQAFLEKHPHVLIEHLDGGNIRTISGSRSTRTIFSSIHWLQSDRVITAMTEPNTH